MKFFPALVLLSCVSCSATSTGEAPSGFVVLGSGVLPSYIGSETTRTVPFVASRVSRGGRGFEVDGLEVRLDVFENEVFRAGPALGVNLPRGEDADSQAIARLDELGAAVNAGVFGGFRVPLEGIAEGTLTGTLTVQQDVSGVHDGTTLTAEIEGFFAANYMLRFGGGISATLASSENMETYFSVGSSDSARSGLPVFDANAGLRDITAELYSILSFSERFGIFTRAAYTRLLGDAADSPIVRLEGDEDQLFLGVGLFWRF